VNILHKMSWNLTNLPNVSDVGEHEAAVCGAAVGHRVREVGTGIAGCRESGTERRWGWRCYGYWGWGEVDKLSLVKTVELQSCALFWPYTFMFYCLVLIIISDHLNVLIIEGHLRIRNVLKMLQAIWNKVGCLILSQIVMC